MKVLITGGVGDIGKITTQRLVENGWDVRVISLEDSIDIPDVEYATCDITDYDGVYKQMEGCDVVVHLAALRAPSLAPAPKLFEINVSGTFNVFEAAAKHGIKRIVQASSINAMGCAWSLYDIEPPYFPIDEEILPKTNDPYSFSKQLDEDIAAYYWRRDGISSVSMRFPWVYQPAYHKSDDYYAFRNKMTDFLDGLANADEAIFNERMAKGRERTLDFRLARSLEQPDRKAISRASENFTDEEQLMMRAYTFDRFNFWTFVDVRDAAQSIEKGLTADYEGSHPLFINDHHNWLEYDSEKLLQMFYPNITQRKTPINGSETLVSMEKARELIGFEPEYSIYDG